MGTFNQLRDIAQYMRGAGKRFYPDTLLEALEHTTTYQNFRNLEMNSQSDLAVTHYQDRTYTDEQVLLKLVHGDKPFLVGKTLCNIEAEPLQAKGARPLVWFKKMEETLEWSFWCYRHNILPLAAENNQKLTVFAAQKYEIDTLICDTASLVTHIDALVEACTENHIKNVFVLDSTFNRELEMKMPHATFSYLLTIPECGILAQLQTDGSLKSADTVLLESVDTKLTITTLLHLPTPLLRYQTHLVCSEASESGFLETFKLTDA